MPPYKEFLQREPVIIVEGAVIERLRREVTIPLDPPLLNASWIYSGEGAALLRRIYEGYITCAVRSNLPAIILTPTWRANPERISVSGYRADDVNGDCFRFLDAIRSGFGPLAERIAIGGLMGCRGDSYSPAEALSPADATAFHRKQALQLAGAGVDFLIGSTLPALSEALGMARAMCESGAPYILSFVLRPEGTLLDGTILSDAIRTIDAVVSPRPLLYMINCVHPDNFRKALAAPGQDRSITDTRIAGLQANTSRKSPEELDGRETLDGEEPYTFGKLMGELHKDFSLRLLGGCCGTDDRHIEAMVSYLTTGEEFHL